VEDRHTCYNRGEKIKSKVETTKKETQDPGKAKGGLKLVVSSK